MASLPVRRRVLENRSETSLASAWVEIQRLKKLTNHITDGRDLVINPDSGGTTPPVSSAEHVLYGSKHTKSLRVTDALSGLNVDYEDGQAFVLGVFYAISASSLTLTNNATNYVFINSAGTIAFNTTGFPAVCVRLAVVVTASGAVSTVTDQRSYVDSGPHLGLQAALRFYDLDNSNFVAIRSTAARSGDITYEMPGTDPSDGQILSAAAPSGGVSALTWTDASANSSGGGLLTILADPLQTEWTNQPSAVTELFGATRHRAKIDLTNASTARLVVDVVVAGATGATLRGQYSLDGSTWFYLDGSGGPSAVIDSIGLAVSSTIMLDGAALADVFIRIVGKDGDAAADPAFGLIMLQFDAVSGTGALPSFLSNFFEETKPGSANALDDEFDDTTGNSGFVNGLNAKWTARNAAGSPSASALTETFLKQGYLKLATPNSNGGTQNIEQTVSGDFQVETVVSIDGTGTAIYAGILGISNGSGVAYKLGMLWNANLFDVYAQKITLPNTFVADLFGAQIVGNTKGWLRLVYVDSTKALSLYYSSDGIGFILLATITASATIDRVGLFIGNDLGSGAAYFDFFRRA